MKVFLSWSGDLSREVANALRKYVPVMLHDIEVFMSQHDISSGDRWGLELARSLEQCEFGILLLTRTNLPNPWLLFEAGALTKHAAGKACGLLLGDLSAADVQAPLSQFQNRSFVKAEVRQLFHDLNMLSAKPLSDDQFTLIFEKFWPDLDSQYQSALRGAEPMPVDVSPRPVENLLQEILITVREISRRGAPPVVATADLLSNALTLSSVAEYTNWRFPGRGISERWQQRMLEDLDLTKYPTLRHINDVVEAVKPAVDAYAAEAPDLFQTGTDFITKSLGFGDADFRLHHPFAQQTKMAFTKYRDLIKLE